MLSFKDAISRQFVPSSLFLITLPFVAYGQYPGNAQYPNQSFGSEPPPWELPAPPSTPQEMDLQPSNPANANQDDLFPETEEAEAAYGTVSVAELQHPMSRKARTLIQKAQTALRKGNLDECFSTLDQAMKERTAEPYVHGVRGAALLIKGRIPEAIPELEQAVQILPLPSNYSNLGYAYLLSGQVEKGEALVRRAASSPDAPLQSHYLIGLVELDSKAHVGDSCADLERAQNMMPAAHIALAVCYARDGRKYAADGQISKVLGPQNESWFEFWRKWVSSVAAQPAPAAAFGLRLKLDPGTKF